MSSPPPSPHRPDPAAALVPPTVPPAAVAQASMPRAEPALPPPPPPAPWTSPGNGALAGGALPARPARAGELAASWRTVYLVTWVGVVIVYASVWRSARTMGLSTWWLGPSSDPQFVVVQLLPFVGPLAAVIAAGRNARFLPHLGIAVALAGIAIGSADVDEFRRLAVLQFVAAGAGLLVSIATFAGMFRRSRPADPTG